MFGTKENIILPFLALYYPMAKLLDSTSLGMMYLRQALPSWNLLKASNEKIKHCDTEIKGNG